MLIKYSTFPVFLFVSYLRTCESLKCFPKGECKNSYPIFGRVSGDHYECRKTCQETAYCAYFTFYAKTSYCQLFKNCDTLDSDSCKECLSGDRDCSTPELNCWMTGKCSGNPLETINAESGDECLAACKANATCQWITYSSYIKSCDIFTECTNLTGCDNCETSNVQCSPNIQESPWHLILGGAGSPNTAELFNFQTGEQCLLPNLPVNAIGHIAASFNGTPMFCEAGTTRKSCFKMDMQTKKFVSIASLMAPVIFGKSIYVPDVGLFVYGRLGNNLKTSQKLTSLDSSWVEGPIASGADSYTKNFCTFQVGSLVTGFLSKSTYRDPYIYNYNRYSDISLNFTDWSTMTSRTATSLPTNNGDFGLRDFPSCVTFKNAVGNLMLGITGPNSLFLMYPLQEDGLTSSGFTYTYFPNEEQLGAPLKLQQLMSINNGTEVLVYGGTIKGIIQSDIYKFTPFTNAWMNVGSMFRPRAAHTVIPVTGLRCP